MGKLKINKIDYVASLAISLLISITVFFFGPLEIFLSASSEFWFDVGDVVHVIFLSTIGCFVCSIFLMILLRVLNRKVFIVIGAFLAGLGVSIYVQGNWIFMDYGIMDGTPINWEQYGAWSWINSLIWIFVSIAVISLFCIEKTRKICICFLYGIIGIELLTLGTLCVASMPDEQSKEFYFSSEGQLELSHGGENVVVIVADGFGGSDFLPALEEAPELKSAFDGFTFYEDTCGTSLYSEESIITLLTGNQFEVGPSFDTNVENAYSNSALYRTLEENDYMINLFLSEAKMVSPDIVDKVENAVSSSVEIKDFYTTFEIIYRMVGFRYAPHILKENFWYSTMDFNSMKASSAFSWSNIAMYELLEDRGVKTVDGNKNVYQFYWIQGPHEPVVMDRYCQPIQETIEMSDEDYKEAQFEQTIGVVRLFVSLIDGLQKAGVYDNTTIIFTADHGWDTRANPLLLIKPRNSNGEMLVSGVPVSMIEDYMPTLTYVISGNKMGSTIFDIDEGMKRSRPFYVYHSSGTDRTYVDRECLYYEEGAFLSEYKLGKTILPNSIERYALEGFSYASGDHIWTDGNESSLQLIFTDTYENILLELECWTYDGRQEVILYANDNKVAHYASNGMDKKQVVIPKEYIEHGKLTLKFELPNAMSPKERGESEDSRKLALAIRSLKLSSTNEVFQEEKQIGLYNYSLGTVVSFTADNPVASNYCIKGFAPSSEKYTWTMGNKSEMQLNVGDVQGDILVNLKILDIVGESQRVNVYANEKYLSDFIVRGEAIESFVVPLEYINNGVIKLYFELPDAVTPKELGINDDTRLLAIAIENISLSLVEE